MDGQDNLPVSSKGMSKTPIIIAVVLVLFILGIGGYLFMGQNTMKPASVQTTMQPKASPTPSSMFSTISEALSKSLSLRCDYSENGMQTSAYIKAGAIRADMVPQSGTTRAMTTEQGGSVIVKNQKMYFWNGKKGFMMEFNPTDLMKQMPSVSPSAKSQTTPGGSGQNMMASLEQFKDHCKPATVDDALFTPPSNVTFTDMSKMMPSGVMPSGTSKVPTGMSQEQIQQMMEKYKTGNP